MWESQGSKVSVRVSKQIRGGEEKKENGLLIKRVTCGAEGYECLSVFADHRQLVFGKGQPPYDVLYKIIGDDRGHVPLQLPQHHQLPVLKQTDRRRRRSPSEG